MREGKFLPALVSDPAREMSVECEGCAFDLRRRHDTPEGEWELLKYARINGYADQEELSVPHTCRRLSGSIVSGVGGGVQFKLVGLREEGWRRTSGAFWRRA